MATPHYPKFHTYKHRPFSYMIRKRKASSSEIPTANGRLRIFESSEGSEVVNLSARPEEGFIHIRLLCLHPAASGDALIGSIVERRLSTKDRASNQTFEALSYCWGSYPKNDTEWRSISIVGNEGYSIFAIRSSLAAALRRLRNKENEYRFLWVDAICIDQTNNDEKSQQIPLMDKIFQSAKRVCIWLGNDKKDQDDVVALRHILKIIKLEGFENLIKPSYTDQWAALASLMKREWFSRRWVVQEIAYARQAKVYWDDQCLDWNDLADAVALFGSKAPEIAELFKQDPKYNHRADFLGDVEALSANRLVQTIGKVFRKADNEQHVERLLSLESLISELSAFNASRPHDIIYAVLSLAKDTITSTTQPEPPQQSPPTRRHSVSHTTLSRGTSQRIDPGIVQAMPTFLGSQLQHNNDVPPTTPVQGPQDDNYFELMCEEWDKSLQRIKEYGFGDDQIETARTRLRRHFVACPEDFDYNAIVENLACRRTTQYLQRLASVSGTRDRSRG